MMRKAAVLWTGGKESSLAYHQASLLGYKITSLITFVPRAPDFLAHPLNFMKYQAAAIGLPHHIIEVSEPFKASYAAAICCLREKQRIDTLITGDIAEVDRQPTPPFAASRLQQSQRICRAGAAFEPVEDDQARRRLAGGSDFVHIEKIAVGQLPASPLERHARWPTEDRPDDGLRMASPAPPRRAEWLDAGDGHRARGMAQTAARRS